MDETIPHPAFSKVENNDMSFRLVFPEFGDKNVYPEATLSFWAVVGMRLINADRWGDTFGLGLYLFVAHNLVLANQAAKAAARGGDPGVGGGLTSNKSVGDVSVGYTYDGVLEKDAGHFNRTVYGQRYWQLAQTMGAGPIQIGSYGSRRPALSGGAWAGPPLWTTWYGST